MFNSGSPTSSAPPPNIESFFRDGGERFEMQPTAKKIAILNSLGTIHPISQLKLFQINEILCYMSRSKDLLKFLRLLQPLTFEHYRTLARTGQFSFYEDFINHLIFIIPESQDADYEITLLLLQQIAKFSLHYLSGLPLAPEKEQLLRIYGSLRKLDVNDAAYNPVIINLCTSYSNIQTVFSTNILHFKNVIIINLDTIILNARFHIDYPDAMRLISLLNNHRELTDAEKHSILQQSHIRVGAPSPGPEDTVGTPYSATDPSSGWRF